MREEPRRDRRPIVVVVIEAEHVAQLADVSTERLLRLAAGGDLLARAALLRYRRRKWKGPVN